MLVKNELKTLQTFNSSHFIGQSYFNNDGTRLYLIFQPTDKTISTFCGLSGTISQWESKGLSNEKNKPLNTANKSLSPKLVWMNNPKIRLRFKMEATAFSLLMVQKYISLNQKSLK